MLNKRVMTTSTLTAVSGHGCRLTDTAGKTYLDFSSGIGVLNLGHSHPRLTKAIQDQAAKLVHAQFTTVSNLPLRAFCEEFVKVVPDHLTEVFPTNSGSEAIDAAMRMARQITKRTSFMVFDGGFHGRTLGAASLGTYTAKIRTGIQPMISGVFTAPYPGVNEQSEEDCIRTVERLLTTQCDPSDLAAVIIEPVQGENAYGYAGDKYLTYLRTLCDRVGALLIVDEIQCGYGRSGTFWAFQKSGILPDIIVAGKAAGGGLPMGLVVCSSEHASRLPVGSLGGTFGGNPLTCAAALETLCIFKDENILDNVNSLGSELDEPLIGAYSAFDWVINIRRVGFMVGIDLDTPERVNDVLQVAEESGLLIVKGGVNGTSLRILPPLNLNREDLREGLEILISALDTVDDYDLQ